MKTMGKTMQLLLLVIAVTQILGIVMLFINLKLAIFIFILYGLAIVALFILLIVNRIKEKEEDDKNDYRNY